ncbi:MAG: DNA repair protein RecO C-terminal domain-containing protein [Cyanobacteriota bacterium]|nr:DNA repair protein RecO C-terminal domain-containing protein [Cyanobacteriota bacterium]
MVRERLVEGLALRCSALGESDRLLTLLSEEDGLIRVAVPGARKPRSRLAAALPMAHLRLQVGGRDLPRVRQLTLLRSFSGLGQRLETLAAAQALAELCLGLVPTGAPAPGWPAVALAHLGRLEEVVVEASERVEALAIAVQGTAHLLALGGYALPLGQCARTGEPLTPPLGDTLWRCSLLPEAGLVRGAAAGAAVVLTASELALLQRLPRPGLPRGRSGVLLGPERVWLRLLNVMEFWCDEHLGRRPRAFRLLRASAEAMPQPHSATRSVTER